MFKRITCFFLGHKLYFIGSTTEGKHKCFCTRCQQTIYKDSPWK